MKVLFIEDNESLAVVVQALLERHEYEVEYFPLGKPGLERFQEDPQAWDVVLLDLELPDMPGHEIIPEIAAKRPTLPIVVYSGTQGIRERFELYSSGASAVVPKPCEAQDLLDVLEGLIEMPPEPIK